jgi:hypothetical protein
MMEAVRTSETSVDNNFTRQYNPEDSSEHHCLKDVYICKYDREQSFLSTRKCKKVPQGGKQLKEIVIIKLETMF